MLLRIIFGAFVVLHGLVHLLYVGQSQRMFELQAGMVWPESSWAFSRLLGAEGTRLVASISFVVAAIAFVASGVGLLSGQGWWRPIVVGTAALSTVVIVLLWDGTFRQLDNQGLIAVFLNLAILVVALALRSPKA